MKIKIIILLKFDPRNIHTKFEANPWSFLTVEKWKKYKIITMTDTGRSFWLYSLLECDLHVSVIQFFCLCFLPLLLPEHAKDLEDNQREV